MRRAPTAVAVILAALGAPPARADDAPPNRRELAGHRFLVSHLVDDPFSVTAFGINIGLGSGEALGSALDLGTSPPTVLADNKWYQYVGIEEQLQFSVRILENLSVRGGINAGVRQGAGEGSALVVGTNVRISGSGGVKGSVALAPSVRVSVALDATYGPQLNVLVLDALLQAQAAGGSLDNADLFNDRDSLTASLGGTVAWAPLPWLGLLGNARWLHTKSELVNGATQDGAAIAASVEFDARPLVEWLPLGANLAYQYTGPLAANGLATVDDWALGIYYTGRPNLALGVEVDQRTGRIETELRSKQTLGWVNFRYFW